MLQVQFNAHVFVVNFRASSLCSDFAHEGPPEERRRRPPQRHPADPEGGHRDAFLTRTGQGQFLSPIVSAAQCEPEADFPVRVGAVRHGNVCDGGEHARQDGGVRQHQEARRHRLQEPAARFDAHFFSPPFVFFPPCASYGFIPAL